RQSWSPPGLEYSFVEQIFRYRSAAARSPERQLSASYPGCRHGKTESFEQFGRGQDLLGRLLERLAAVPAHLLQPPECLILLELVTAHQDSLGTLHQLAGLEGVFQMR